MASECINDRVRKLYLGTRNRRPRYLGRFMWCREGIADAPEARFCWLWSVVARTAAAKLQSGKHPALAARPLYIISHLDTIRLGVGIVTAIFTLFSHCPGMAAACSRDLTARPTRCSMQAIQPRRRDY